MKTITYFLILISAILVLSCDPDDPEYRDVKFKNMEEFTMNEWLDTNKAEYSSFIAIVEAGGLKSTISGYNPYGSGYTLFLPDNNAIDEFIAGSDRFSTLDDVVNDKGYAQAFAAFHIVDMEAASNSFPFGAFSEMTLSGDFLTVSIVNEPDTSYFKINTTAVVKKEDIEVSNGYIHLITSVLEPVVFTSYEWLEDHPDYSIFKAAVDLTGTRSLLDFNLKETEEARLGTTLLVEPDSIYQQIGIQSVDDLIAYIDPSNEDYTSEFNELYGFVAYHILDGSFFIDNFVDQNTVYTTYSEVPLNINGEGIDITINAGKQVFDTLVFQGDTTILNYITFKYDASNVLTQSGAIHFIDQVMTQKQPSIRTVNFDFMEEGILKQYRNEGGTFEIEEGALQRITWSGGDLEYVKLEDLNSLWNNDYLMIDGDFVITYRTVKIVNGTYDVVLRANQFSEDNALVEVFIDGKKIGSTVDLSRGGNANNPFQSIPLGTIDFFRFTEHTVEVRALIPGVFMWDVIQFKKPE